IPLGLLVELEVATRRRRQVAENVLREARLRKEALEFSIEASDGRPRFLAEKILGNVALDQACCDQSLCRASLLVDDPLNLKPPLHEDAVLQLKRGDLLEPLP